MHIWEVLKAIQIHFTPLCKEIKRKELLPMGKQVQDKLLRKKHKINWHHAVCEVLKIELEEYLDELKFLEEYHLGKSKDSLRVDILIIQKYSNLHIPKQIAEKFQTYNLIEYKSPEDNLSIDDYYKLIGYACIFRFNTGKVNEVENKEITLTFITSKFPQKLQKELKERKIILAKRAPGIYDIEKEIFRIQLVVNRQLDEEETIWLRCLDNRLREKQLYERLEQSYSQHKNEPRYSAPMNAIIWSNYQQKGEKNIMCEALYDLFADELVEHEVRGKAEGEERFASLTEKLLQDFRTEDLLKATKDKAFREALYQEYGIKNA